MATRNPVRVLPVPVGEATRTFRPAAMSGQRLRPGGATGELPSESTGRRGVNMSAAADPRRARRGGTGIAAGRRPGPFHQRCDRRAPVQHPVSRGRRRQCNAPFPPEPPQGGPGAAPLLAVRLGGGPGIGRQEEVVGPTSSTGYAPGPWSSAGGSGRGASKTRATSARPTFDELGGTPRSPGSRRPGARRRLKTTTSTPGGTRPAPGSKRAWMATKKRSASPRPAAWGPAGVVHRPAQQDVDAGRPRGDGPAERHVVHHPAVDQCLPVDATGGRMAGMAAEARTASTAGPRDEPAFWPSVSEAATTSRGTSASSRCSKSMPSSMIWRSPALECTAGRCWRKVHGPWARPRGKTWSPLRLRQTSSSWAHPAGRGVPAVGGAVHRPDRGAVDAIGPDAPVRPARPACPPGPHPGCPPPAEHERRPPVGPLMAPLARPQRATCRPTRRPTPPPFTEAPPAAGPRRCRARWRPAAPDPRRGRLGPAGAATTRPARCGPAVRPSAR